MARQLLKAATITRPADTTAYAQFDLVANSTTVGSVTPFTFDSGSGQGLLAHRFRMLSSNDTITNKNFQLYLFAVSPTVSNGDNGAFAVTAANGSNNLIGIFGSSAALSSGGGSVNTFLPVDGAGTFLVRAPMLVPGKFYGLLRANAAYTPTSEETFQLWAEVEPD